MSFHKHSAIAAPPCRPCHSRHLFIELGLNRGQTLESLLLGGTHDRGLVAPLLRELLGNSSTTFLNDNVWWHGFEANPALTSPLLALLARLREPPRHCVCVKLNLETVASVSNAATVPFYLDGRRGCNVDGKCFGPGQPYYAEGSTFDPVAGHRLHNMRAVNLKSQDAAQYIRDQLRLADIVRRRPHLQGSRKVVLRMDIEGGEYTLLPHLLRPIGEGQAPVLCLVDLLLLEFHSKRHPAQVVAQHAKLRDRFAAECPALIVVLDPANYEKLPWNATWPHPEAWLRGEPFGMRALNTSLGFAAKLLPQ